jgi:hypothetical protein
MVTRKINYVCLSRYLHFLQEGNEQLTKRDLTFLSATYNYLSSQEIPRFYESRIFIKIITK